MPSSSTGASSLYEAFRLTAAHRLPTADTMMLATARAHRAIWWTQDADFVSLSGVKYRPAPKRR